MSNVDREKNDAKMQLINSDKWNSWIFNLRVQQELKFFIELKVESYHK
jgi:hypothetical protein